MKQCFKKYAAHKNQKILESLMIFGVKHVVGTREFHIIHLYYIHILGSGMDPLRNKIRLVLGGGGGGEGSELTLTHHGCPLN
jgi:hypothetical protein